MNENCNSCVDCRYHRTVNGEGYCDKISEKLLSFKGCGHHQTRSPFDMKHCPACGKAVVDGAHAIRECIKEG